MVRPRRCRRVVAEPDVDYFKPQGVPLSAMEQVDISVDEFESFRLMDHEGLDQKTSALRMKISQPTFCRLYSDARVKLAKAIVEGLAIKIHGGAYKMPGMDRTGPRGEGPMTGRGMGRCGPRVRRGLGRGVGMGGASEKEVLLAQKEAIDERLAELE